MAKPNLRVRLTDMFEAIDEATAFLVGIDLSAFQADAKTRRSVERCIEIISEASRHIPAELAAGFPHIPWPEVRAIGNQLRHEYYRVSDAIIWKVASNSLPELRPVIQQMLDQLDEAETT